MFCCHEWLASRLKALARQRCCGSVCTIQKGLNPLLELCFRQYSCDFAFDSEVAVGILDQDIGWQLKILPERVLVKQDSAIPLVRLWIFHVDIEKAQSKALHCLCVVLRHGLAARAIVGAEFNQGQHASCQLENELILVLGDFLGCCL